jgi:oligopeptidase A
MDNPLLGEATDVAFDRIRPEHVVPAVEELLGRARADVAAIAAQTGPETYDSTLGALDRATLRLEHAFAVVEHLESVATSPGMRAAFGPAQAAVSAFWSGLPLDEGLFAAIERFAASPEARDLVGVRRRHLDKVLEDFERSGARLPAADKERLRAIDVELAAKTTRFAQNALDATNAFELYVDDEARLSGLPELAKKAARAAAEQRDRPGFRFTLHAPSFTPAITYLDDRALREELWWAQSSRATSGALDNRPLIREILRLRRDKARLLGLAHFADLATADRMAKTGARARAFLADLRSRTAPFFEADKRELVEHAKKLGIESLEPWDVPWVAERLRRERLDFDEEELRPYFQVGTSIEGVFEVLRRLYGVVFRLDPSAPTWHADVRVYRLEEEGTGERLATVHVDLHPREDKNAGAWMCPLRVGLPPEVPHVAVVAANFTPPIGDRPALLNHREVETLFHEFGHLVHACVSRVPVRRLAATNVAWDFVELPSQIMENWMWHEESLDLFAAHEATGERLPKALVDRVRAARRFRVASAQMQQIGFAELDLALHAELDPDGDEDPVTLAHRVISAHGTAPLPEGYAMIASFGHLFASPVGYAAGYYSYKWAEVLAADAFGRFLEEGLLDRKVGLAFRREVLERGDSADPEALFEAFRGRPPTVDALLARQGLVAAPPA